MQSITGMSRLTAALFLLLAVTGTLQAAEPNAVGQNAAGQESLEKFNHLMGLYINKLELDQKEQESVRPILWEHFKKRCELRLKAWSSGPDERRRLCRSCTETMPEVF